MSNAHFSLVRFRDLDTGIKCDLNVNEHLGYRNTLMIRQYCTILPILPTLILQLKRWAKKQKWMTTLNSYALAVMAIGVLQVCYSDLLRDIFSSLVLASRHSSQLAEWV